MCVDSARALWASFCIRLLSVLRLHFGLTNEWKCCHQQHTTTARWLKCCFTATETVGLLGTGAQDVHLDFHTAPELWHRTLFRSRPMQCDLVEEMHRGSNPQPAILGNPLCPWGLENQREERILQRRPSSYSVPNTEYIILLCTLYLLACQVR